MAGLNLGPSYGAGGTADALQRILEQRFRERQIALQEQQAQRAYEQQQRQNTLADQTMARDAAMERFKLLSGLPRANWDASDLEAQSAGSAPVPGVGSVPVPVFRAKAIEVPGVNGMGAFKARPMSLEDAQATQDAAALRKLRLTPINVPAGGTVLLNGQTYSGEPQHSAIYKEYQDALQEGYKGTFQQYQNEDANRKKPVTVVGMSEHDPQDIADAIMAGNQPPTLQGLYRYGAPVRAELARRGYNLATAQTDWNAVQKHIATLNGPQQTRLRQAAETAYHSLDIIEDLAKQWQGGRFPLLNRAQLAMAKNGALGAQAQTIATQLEAQISDLTSELGNVYMGGNSPTDHSLGLAAKNLSADWSLPQLRDALGLARKNLQIRLNSIRNTGVVGASDANAYAPPTQPAAVNSPVEEWGWVNGKLVKKGGQ